MPSSAAPGQAFPVSKFNSFTRATCNRGWLVAILAIIFWLSGGGREVRGQSAIDGFDPNANNVVRVVVLQPDGKILIGGDFTTLSPNGGAAVTRNHIARLNPDGTLDAAFNPDANSSVVAILVQADGKILVGGGFSIIGGQQRACIARLDGTTGLADSLAPTADDYIYAFAVQADGKILVGGAFRNIGSQARSRIARLDPGSGLADSFNPNANLDVNSILVQKDGKILVGGGFSSIGGQTRGCMARLDAATGLADSFDPDAGAGSFVQSIVLQADGKILVAGGFGSIGGQSRSGIARLDAATGLADSFNPNANSIIYAIAVQADGKILAGGDFRQANSIGGQTRNFIARLDAATGLADSFDPNGNLTVYSIAVQADGKIIAGGTFTTLAPNGGGAVTRNYAARLETNGRVDQTLDLNTIGTNVRSTAVQADGKILIGGTFTSVLGVPRNNIARLNADGTLDMAFNPNANFSVYAIAVQADGKILVGGMFFGSNSIGGQTRNFIARLDATTGLADSFDPNANNYVFSLAVQADGKILVGGQFNSIGGQARGNITRLDATTGLADSFNPNSNNAVYAIAVQADGKIVVGGAFSFMSGQPRNFIARLDATTGLADSFNPNANLSVLAIVVQTDGKILVGGVFTNIGGQARFRIARFDATTGQLDSFDPNTSTNSAVYTIALQANGKILVGGQFTVIGGQPRTNIARIDATTGLPDSFNPNPNGNVHAIAVQADGRILAGGVFTNIGGQPRKLFARLSNDTAALQNLAVTQTSITWTRSGSSPQFASVTFEYSTDNLNYSSLGNGTAAGNNWSKTGLSLTIGMNFYVRARGHYRSGGFTSSSESTLESVRNAFVAGPTAADSIISGRILAADGTPVPGTIVDLTGEQTRRAFTDASGNYHFDNVETGGFYTVTPTLENFSFNPSARSFSQLGARTEVAFTATRYAVQVGNVIDTAEYFVRQQYLDFLSREPDQEGWAYWSDQINACGADLNCLCQKRLDVSAAFFMSAEFQQSGNYVYRLYRAAFLRQLTYAEFTADHNLVVAGPDLELHRTEFANSVVLRPEFLQKYQEATTAETFVASLLHNVLVDAQVDLSSQRAALIANYQSAGDLSHSRSAVLQAVAESSEFKAAVYEPSFVLMEYFGYLRRDIDQSGFDFWVAILNNLGPGNYRGMVCSFITSTEYQQRFGSVVSHSNGECGQ